MSAADLVRWGIERGLVRQAPAPTPRPKRTERPWDRHWYHERSAANRAAGLRYDGKPRTRKSWHIHAATHAEYMRKWRVQFTLAGLRTDGKPRTHHDTRKMEQLSAS